MKDVKLTGFDRVPDSSRRLGNRQQTVVDFVKSDLRVARVDTPSPLDRRGLRNLQRSLHHAIGTLVLPVRSVIRGTYVYLERTDTQ